MDGLLEASGKAECISPGNVLLYILLPKRRRTNTRCGKSGGEERNIFGFAYANITSESFILESAGYFLSALYKQESSGERKSQLRNCLKW